MKHTILFILSLLVWTGCPPDKFVAQKALYEVRLDEDGSVRRLKSIAQVNRRNCETIIRGTNWRVPFDKNLYNKYYYRVVRYTDGKRDTVEANGNYRHHQESDKRIYRAYDVPKIDGFSTDYLLKNIDVIKQECLASPIMQQQSIQAEDNWIDLWPVGTKEKYEFPIFRGEFEAEYIKRISHPDSIDHYYIPLDSIQAAISETMPALQTFSITDKTSDKSILRNSEEFTKQVKESWFKRR